MLQWYKCGAAYKKLNKTSLDMAKIQIKSEKLTSFGGIFPIMEKFDRMLSHTIDSTLGLRSKVYGYQYSEIIRSLMCVYFCGGSCAEDVTSHLMEALCWHPHLRTCSADTILRAIRELTTPNLTYRYGPAKRTALSYSDKEASIRNSTCGKGNIHTGAYWQMTILRQTVTSWSITTSVAVLSVYWTTWTTALAGTVCQNRSWRKTRCSCFWQLWLETFTDTSYLTQTWRALDLNAQAESKLLYSSMFLSLQNGLRLQDSTYWTYTQAMMHTWWPSNLILGSRKSSWPFAYCLKSHHGVRGYCLLRLCTIRMLYENESF